MKKRMRIMLILMAILFGGIFLYKYVIQYIIKQSIAKNKNPIVIVSAMQVAFASWQPSLSAIGSLRAIRGVDVTAQLAGMVQQIYFTPGSTVTKDDVLVQLNADTDVAQLQSLKANAELARITYDRDKAQFAVRAISKQQLDVDLQNLRSLRAQVEAQETIVKKKSISAPFTGRLGINYVNPGQFINPGDRVVTLQTLDPIYADFYMPQQNIAKLMLGQKVEVTVDAFVGKIFTGKITTINPAVDVNTRNVEVEATLANSDFLLLPGMFAQIKVLIGDPVQYLTLPQTAVSFNPYGQLVYILQKSPNKEDKDVLIAKQTFVTTGDVRGDQVAILQGLKAGDTVVTSGQLKLKNNSRVTINNSVVPLNQVNPITPDEH